MSVDLDLKTDRLYLRPITVDDVDLIWPYVSDPELPRYMSWDAHKNKAETRQFLERIQDEMENGKSIHWAIFIDGQFCGLISLIAVIRQHRALIYDKAELAYWLARDFRKRGIMTEAGEKVIGFAFQELGFHRLTVSHVAQNKASERLIRKWGFRYIGEEREAFQKHGTWVNHKLYELLEKDYTGGRCMTEKTPYVCPETLKPLYAVKNPDTGEIVRLETDEGKWYPVKEGIPDLTFPRDLKEPDAKARDFYDSRVEDYDKYLPLTFKTHNVDEQEARNSFIDCLELQSGDRVLDLACGTGRDSEIIAQRLGGKGEIFMLDIAPLMLRRCMARMERFTLRKEFCIANAVHLPYPDDFFDAVYSFGGLGEFSDIKRSLAEMVRVTKVGGKVVVGDESIPPWLRNTDFAKILITTNPQFRAEVPLEEMPVEAREVCLKWVINGVFYLIDFRVGEGEPDANFDFEIPGPRGGTYRTRYEGQLEGVTKETKELAWKAAKARGVSMHKWLDEVVKNAALEDLAESQRSIQC